LRKGAYLFQKYLHKTRDRAAASRAKMLRRRVDDTAGPHASAWGVNALGLGKMARKRALQYLSWDAIAEETIRIYQSLIDTQYIKYFSDSFLEEIDAFLYKDLAVLFRKRRSDNKWRSVRGVA
jgi:hypothetical protein